MPIFRVSWTLIFILLLFLVISACTTTDIQDIDVPTATRTPYILATVSFEQTAIARFTENPELASSMTPFYGAILWNEAIRQITETPVFDSERECYLVADYWKMSNSISSLEENIESDLIDNNISAVATAFAHAVWHSANCGEYILVSNSIGVWIEPDDGESSTDASSQLETIINSIVTATSSEINISQDLFSVEVTITGGSPSELLLYTNLQVISEALAENLTGTVLIEALNNTYP